MANILITGANGQLGSELRKIGFSPLDEVFFTDVAELDITDYTAIEKFIQVHEVDTIINCAAYTAVDRAEDEPGPAAEINTQAVANLAKAAQKGDCLLIHLYGLCIRRYRNDTLYRENKDLSGQCVR